MAVSSLQVCEIYIWEEGDFKGFLTMCFGECINPNIGLQSIVLYTILMTLLVYLNRKNVSKTEHIFKERE